MMRPNYLIVTTSGVSNPIPLDRYVNGYAIGCYMTTPGIQYTLQHSFNEPFQRWTVNMNTSAQWFNCGDTRLVNASTNRDTNYAFPPTAIRVIVSAGASAGNPLHVAIIPMGMDGN